MLARRLLMFAAILLVVTTISAALAPPPRLDERSPRIAEGDPLSTGPAREVARTIDAAQSEPATVKVAPGDVLSLTVRADESAAVQLEGLASIRPVSPTTDAVFDVRPTRPGDYPVVLLDAEQRTVGTVRVISPD